MKYNSLAVVLPAILLSSTSYAVELYNKDGNTIDFYGYVMGDYHFSKKMTFPHTGIRVTPALVSKAQQKLILN